MSATSLNDQKLTDSLERELIAQATADEAQRAASFGPALRALWRGLRLVFFATLEGVKAARPVAAKGEW